MGRVQHGQTCLYPSQVSLVTIERAYTGYTRARGLILSFHLLHTLASVGVFPLSLTCLLAQHAGMLFYSRALR